ncbi:MAG: response regulator [Gemmatimonadetes bacterium]|nr:response regulator [Gemmatimonadota bacterium]
MHATPPTPMRRRGIRGRLLRVAALVAVPLSLLAVARAFERRANELAVVRKRAEDHASVVARALETQVRSVHALMAGIASQLDPTEDPAQLDRRLQRLANTAPFGFANTWVVRSDGRLVAGLQLPPDTGAARVVGGTASFRNTMTQRAFAVGDVRRSTVMEGAPFIMTFGIPLRDGDRGDIHGILGASILVDSLEALGIARTLPPGSVISVLDSTGRVILRSQDLDTRLGRSYRAESSFRNAPSEESGVELVRSDDGIERQVAFRRLATLGWVVYVGMPAASTVNIVQQQLLRDLAYALLVTIAVLVGAAIVTRRLVQPLQQLTADATAIATGDEARRSRIRSDDEIGDLASAVNLMAATAAARRDALERDMQARVEAERALQESRDQLRQAQKMEALGSFAGGIAHDFNNYLAAILGFTQLAREHTAAGTAERADLDEVIAATQRAAALARQILVFSRKSIVHPQPLDLHEVVTGIDRMLEPLLGEGRTLALALADDARWVRFDRGQLEQVIVNLATNARDAMPTGGTFTLRSRAIRIMPGEALASTLAPGPWVRLSASDTGVGMSEAVRERAFEPFYSTKERGRGAGLGLALVYSMITQIGGTVQIESREGVGTTVHLWLPATDAPVPAGASSAADGDATVDVEPASHHVLVVEDDGRVRDMAARLLEHAGYRVSVAMEGGEALELLTRNDDIGLVLTDVIMPGMDGRALAQTVYRLHPGVPVVFMSGYVDDDDFAQVLRERRLPWLGKPFTRESLLAAVSAALAPAPTAASPRDVGA